MESVGNFNYTPAPKGKRVLSDIFDLVIIPIVIGVIAGLFFLNSPELVRGLSMIALNIGWLLFRDVVFAPGRAITGIKLISINGSRVTVGQAFIRNILLVIPVVLLLGYVIELISVLAKNERLADRWANTRVIA